jgi:hypothetical protein
LALIEAQDAGSASGSSMRLTLGGELSVNREENGFQP